MTEIPKTKEEQKALFYKAMNLATEALKNDDAGLYEEAITKYIDASDLLTKILRGFNEVIITADRDQALELKRMTYLKAEQYLNRAAELRDLLESKSREFLQRAIYVGKGAELLEEKKDYQTAISSYIEAAGLLAKGIKWSSVAEERMVYHAKAVQYLKRAETLRDLKIRGLGGAELTIRLVLSTLEEMKAEPEKNTWKFLENRLEVIRRFLQKKNQGGFLNNKIV